MKKQIITTIVLVFTITLCFAQTREILELNKSYSHAKIYKKNNEVIKVRNMTLVNDSTLNFKYDKTDNAESIALDDLRGLKVKYGTKAGRYALYGGGFMALTSLLGWGRIESDPNMETKDNAGAIAAGFIVGGAAVGGLVGLAFPKWKSISIPRKKSVNTSLYFSPVIGVQKNYYALSINVKF